MVLDVFLEREDGTRIETARDLQGAADWVMSRSDGTVCMQFIDPYGYTMFNRIQCGVLRDEWTRVLADAPAELQTWAAEAAGLIERCAAEFHLYVRFVGD